MMKYTQLKNARKEQLRALPENLRQPLVEEQIRRQVAAHQHRNYKVDIKLTDAVVLKDFSVHERVMRPEVMSSLYLARYLFFNQSLYQYKQVLDMGCGCGIQGVVMGLNGAWKLYFSDISPEAVENTKENVQKFGLNTKISYPIPVFQSNLFESDNFNHNKSQTFLRLLFSPESYRKIRHTFDLIVFNHPFFSDLKLKSTRVDDSMIQPATLLERFLKEAKQYLTEKGKIVMSYFHLAGSTNDPEDQAPKYGYNVTEVFGMNIQTGLQKGPYSIYELKI